MKFQKGFIVEYEKQLEKEQEQKELRKKHSIDDDNVVVVEKPTLTKYLLQTAGIIIRVLASIALAILAAIGILALLYPEPRAAIQSILEDGLQQIQSLLP